MGRELLQIKADPYVCSAYCEQNKCIRVGTTGNVKCNQCKATFRPILSGVNAGQCGERQLPSAAYDVSLQLAAALPKSTHSTELSKRSILKASSADHSICKGSCCCALQVQGPRSF